MLILLVALPVIDLCGCLYGRYSLGSVEGPAAPTESWFRILRVKRYPKGELFQVYGFVIDGPCCRGPSLSQIAPSHPLAFSNGAMDVLV